MRTYVLVHGAWHGAWIWRDIAPRLRAEGHAASAPTLTGLGQRRHLAHRGIDLDLHVEDVVAHIEMEGLENITLVGWSYGGMVITDVLARMPERIASMIYLDAFVPERGKSLADYAPPPMRAGLEAARDKGEDVPIRTLDQFAVTEPDVVAFAGPRLTPQPVGPMFQPSKALAEHPPHIPRTYVRATAYVPSIFEQFYEALKDNPDWNVETVHTGHLMTMTRPDETAAILLRAP